MVRCSIMSTCSISLILQSSGSTASDVHHQCSLVMCVHASCMQHHHCLWTNNCVGHGNYKTFLLFLVCEFSCDASCKSKEHFQQANIDIWVMCCCILAHELRLHCLSWYTIVGCFPLLPAVGMMLMQVSMLLPTTSDVDADVNAAAIHALGLLIAHAAHLIGLNSEHRHNAARSSSSTVALHTLTHAKHNVFWAIMEVPTGQHTLMDCCSVIANSSSV